MPFARCREYDDDGNPKKNGCKVPNCGFVHPTQPAWDRAPRSKPIPLKSRHFTPQRGRGRGRGGPPSGPRDRTGSNTVPRSDGSGSNAGTDSGWGSKAASWGGSWHDADKIAESSTGTESWSKGWGAQDDTTKDADGNRGKGKAAESSWVADGWGQVTVNNEKGGWGSWGASSPKAHEINSSGWGWNGTSEEPTNSKGPTVSPSIGTTLPSDTSAIDLITKTEELTIASDEPPTAMEIDPPQNLVAPASATLPTSTRPFDSPVINNGPGSSLQRHITPVASAPTSRSASLVPIAPPSREKRSLKSVSHKEAKKIWNEYLKHIYRSITMKLLLMEEQDCHKDYKVAQNSPIYVRVGSRGAKLLNDGGMLMKGRLEERKNGYRSAVDRLCAFEDGFDFPLHILTGRREDTKKMKEEVNSAGEYLKDVRICVDRMLPVAEDIEKRANTTPAPTAPPTPVIKTQPQETQLTVTSAKELELDARLKSLEDKATDLSNTFLDIRGTSTAFDVIQNKFEEKKASLVDLLEEGEVDEMSDRVTKLDDDQTSLGQDLDDLCGDVAELFTSFKETEVAAEQELVRLKASIEEDRQILAAREAHNLECQGLLDKSTESLVSLRQGLPALQESQSQNPAGIPNDLLDQLVAALLLVIRSHLYPDVQIALKTMTSSVSDVMQEHNKEQVQELHTLLSPVYRMTSELHSRIELKSQRITMHSRPASPHVGDARVVAQAQTSHS